MLPSSPTQGLSDLAQGEPAEIEPRRGSAAQVMEMFVDPALARSVAEGAR